MESPKMHVVVCAYPALGHIHPSLHLSTLLAAKGIRVTFVSTQFYCDRLRRRARRSKWQRKSRFCEGVIAAGAVLTGQAQDEGDEACWQGQGKGSEEAKQQWRMQEEEEQGEGGGGGGGGWQDQAQEGTEEEEGSIRFEALCDGLPPNFDRTSPSTELSRAVDQLHSEFAELMSCLLRSTSPAPSLLISDAFLPWTHDVASALHIPRALFWPMSMAVFTIFVHTDLLLTNGINLFQDDLSTSPSPVIDFIPGVPALPTSHLPYRVKPVGGQDRRFLLYESLVNLSKQCKEVSCILANSFDNLEGLLLKVLQNKVGDSMKLVGPLLPLPSPYRENQVPVYTHAGGVEDILQWLNTKALSSVLYISLGSVVTWTKTQVEEVGLGLIAKKQTFLWVMRPWEMRLALPQGLLKLGRIVKFAPQLQVLGHPAIGGFMSHCGWNSTLESLSMGVPMLAWPHFVDQFTNCWYVVHVWKVGVELIVLRKGDVEDDVVDRSEFERAVTLLMQSEDGRMMRQRASKLGDTATNSVLLGSSCKDLEVFLSELASGSIATVGPSRDSPLTSTLPPPCH